jgi:hypothetical protein
MTMIVIEEDHYVYEVVYGAGSYTITREKSAVAMRSAASMNRNEQE